MWSSSQIVKIIVYVKWSHLDFYLVKWNKSPGRIVVDSGWAIIKIVFWLPSLVFLGFSTNRFYLFSVDSLCLSLFLSLVAIFQAFFFFFFLRILWSKSYCPRMFLRRFFWDKDTSGRNHLVMVTQEMFSLLGLD